MPLNGHAKIIVLSIPAMVLFDSFVGAAKDS